LDRNQIVVSISKSVTDGTCPKAHSTKAQP
jgi:hypothetical protein